MTVRRLVRNDYELQDAADALTISREDAARDLALLSVIAALVDRFGDRIVFKGGAALRFAHGASRTSRDADATVIKPARAPIPAEQVMAAISDARMGQFLRLRLPAAPRTDNNYSLDVDRVAFSCAETEGTLDVELSYREDVHLEPTRATIGEPYLNRSQSGSCGRSRWPPRSCERSSSVSVAPTSPIASPSSSSQQTNSACSPAHEPRSSSSSATASAQTNCTSGSRPSPTSTKPTSARSIPTLPITPQPGPRGAALCARPGNRPGKSCALPWEYRPPSADGKVGGPDLAADYPPEGASSDR